MADYEHDSYLSSIKWVKVEESTEDMEIATSGWEDVEMFLQDLREHSKDPLPFRDARDFLDRSLFDFKQYARDDSGYELFMIPERYEENCRGNDDFAGKVATSDILAINPKERKLVLFDTNGETALYKYCSLLSIREVGNIDSISRQLGDAWLTEDVYKVSLEHRRYLAGQS